MPIAIRKFNDTQTLGDALRALRFSIPRTLSEMAAATKIQKTVLEAFEQNAFSRLPPPSYAERFLKTYVKALGGDVAYFLERYQEECGVCDITHISLLPPRRARPGLRLTGMSVAKTTGVLVAVLAVIVYLGFEVRNITAPPKLAIEFPVDGYVTKEAVVRIRGIADPKATVKVNGTEVLTYPDGTFQTNVALERGLNVVTVEGAKRYSRPAEALRRIILEQDRQSAVLVPFTTTN